MCLIALVYRTLPHTPLLVLANRDEAFARPTDPLARWADTPMVLGGRDRQAGGGWLAVSEQGRFAAVTNVRAGQPLPAEKSRGALVAQWVQGTDTVAQFAQQLATSRHAYGGVNLIFGTLADLFCYHSPHGSLQPLASGVTVICNGAPDAPWFKVERLRAQCAALSTPLPPEDQLLDWLTDPTPAPCEALPDTGVGYALEKRLSPIFIAETDYGTRASTLLSCRADGALVMVERTFVAGQLQGVRRLGGRALP